VKITVFDTPGLADGTDNDERYLRQMKEKVNTVDLFLFCTDMSSKRFSDDDTKTITKLTETFGARLWDHALVVLTFANQVDLGNTNDGQQRISLFQKKIGLFQEKIQDFLRKKGVPEEAATNLPFVPAGKVTQPRLPDRENWLMALWIAALTRIKKEAKADFMLASFHRISFPCEVLSVSECPAETDRMTKRESGERECGKDYGIVNCCTEGNNNAVLCDHRDVNETKRGSLGRPWASASKDHADNVMTRYNRPSVSELETEQHVSSRRECQIQYSLPPAFDEVVSGNQTALPMDESASQVLFNELVHESISNQQTGEFAGASTSQRSFRRLYAVFFARIIDFVKKLLRGKMTTRTKKHEGPRKENADKV